MKTWTEMKQAGIVTLVQESYGPYQPWRPAMRFRQKPLRQCPFLVNSIDEQGRYRGLCRLHLRHKPLVCRLAPLARSVEDDGHAVVQDWFVVAPVEGCPGMGIGRLRMAAPPKVLSKRLDREVEWVRALLRCSDQLSERETAEAFWASEPFPLMR